MSGPELKSQQRLMRNLNHFSKVLQVIEVNSGSHMCSIQSKQPIKDRGAGVGDRHSTRDFCRCIEGGAILTQQREAWMHIFCFHCQRWSRKKGREREDECI